MPILKSNINDVPTEDAAARAAVLKLQGVGLNKIVQILSEEFQFNFTRAQVDRLRKKEIYQVVIKEHQEALIKGALNDLKRDAATLVPLVISTLKNNLEENNIQAVAPTLKILGLDNETAAPQAQNLTVVLPGQPIKEKEVYSVESEPESVDEGRD